MEDEPQNRPTPSAEASNTSIETTPTPVHPELREGLSENVRREAGMVLDTMKEAFGTPEHFVGSGRTAEIYELPTAPDICIKYIVADDAYASDNHLYTEYQLLKKAGGVKVKGEGVRAPRAGFVRISETEGHQLGQERVRGRNLEEIMADPNEPEAAKLLLLAKSIDRNSLISQSQEFVDQLYENHGIAHDNLLAQDLMLDESGRLFVIDFGKAKQKGPGVDLAIEHARDKESIKASLMRFFAFVDEAQVNAA